ncbi:hypothetical protein LCGC14_0389360 [marine sediment metagenome]|uniref:Uncharacterized protein n=1 Tax=marine sediment metagenome TaxID=412755 RepID=A0A0F9T5Q0_9ZZZZ
MSTFDAESFMSQAVDGEMETRYTPIPDNNYVAMLSDKLTLREVNDSPVVDVLYIIDDEELRAKMDVEELIVKQSLFTDVNDDGRIAFGTNKNVKLGRLRAALGQNVAGQTWNFQMLAGAGPVRIKVGHRPDKNDPTIVYNEVNAVASMQAT